MSPTRFKRKRESEKDGEREKEKRENRGRRDGRSCLLLSLSLAKQGKLIRASTSTRAAPRVHELPRAAERQGVTHASSFNTFLGNVHRFLPKKPIERRTPFFFLPAPRGGSLCYEEKNIGDIISPPEMAGRIRNMTHSVDREYENICYSQSDVSNASLEIYLRCLWYR